MSTYFGFAISDSMFPASGTIIKKPLTLEEVKELIEQGISPCLNPSHIATINAMNKKFDITVPIPDSPPKISLQANDRIIIMGVQGLPRLTDRHEYTEEEIDNAEFSFSLYQVLPEFVSFNVGTTGEDFYRKDKQNSF
jgi:hypothetical protein